AWGDSAGPRLPSPAGKGDPAHEGVMTMPETLYFLTIAEAAELIRTRRLSPVELTRAILDRIEALDGSLHAYITVTADAALRQAAQAEAEIAAGRYRGPLHGIPIAHKDIVWTKGVRTTAHSKLLADWVPAEDATVVRLLDEAGAVNLGKLSCHEFACGTPNVEEPFPAALNPWNLSYSPGGSSSGSGTAVAAGLALGAIGTDTGGSIRHPSAVCGIVGMKPTHGRVSAYGVIPLSTTLDHVGPMTRTVRDNAIMLQVLAGYDPKDPESVDAPVPDYLAGIEDGVKGLRLGVPEPFLATIDNHPEVLAAFQTAREVLGDLGAAIRPLEIAGLEELPEAQNTIMLYEAYQYHRQDLAERPELFGAPVRDRIIKGADYSPDDYRAALEARARIQASYGRALEEVDLILSPGREAPAVSMADLMAQPMAVRGVSTRMYNLTGLPALVQPAGFSSDRLPLSLQLAGRPFDEALIYRAAQAYEAATEWTERHPALESVPARRQ
ncbi:MAG TPA: amidase, partial [Dehalococcoidia bacterium]|nr:amidase [Dehalococcoidia bacterium]